MRQGDVMGFLDRMVADMVGDATGLPVKKLVRRVGAGKLLLLGGAAAAGAYVVHTMNQKQGAAPRTSPPGSAAGTVPPPPPQSSGPAPVLPPLPVTAPAQDEPEHAGPADGLSPKLTCAVVRTMVAAALADGRLAAEEKRAIHDHLGSSDLREDQLALIHQELILPATPEELAALEEGEAEKKALYRAALLVTMADHDLSAVERDWLGRLGHALRLSAEVRAEVEADLVGSL